MTFGPEIWAGNFQLELIHKFDSRSILEQFSTNLRQFSAKNGVFLKNQCYDHIFA
jgi:hypothetical protein